MRWVGVLRLIPEPDGIASRVIVGLWARAEHADSQNKKPATSFDVAGLAGTPVAVLAVGEPSEFCSRPSASGPKALAVRPLPGASTSPLKELAVPSRAPLKDRAGRREVIDPAHPFISAGSSGLQNAVQAAGLLH
jgi:hypothetical protein